ncbi:MAG: flagellar hook-length control protein FliK [Butyrivibrio sp.]|jgi:flagellar hook-length control protein FliK|nr:flagellar hook-length control protein FliK [Butyrivibrio sp.]
MDNHLYIGVRQTNGTAQIQSPVESAGAQARLRTLSAGQTIQGKVVSVSTSADGTGTAQISLGNNIVVSAKLQGNMALNAGQNISFEVRSTSSGTVTLSPLYENTAADSSAMKALNAAGLAANDTTLEMVRDMMESGMSIDRSSILEMSRNIMEYPSADVSSLVQMTKMNIPINDVNVQQFQNYQNYQHQVVSSVNMIMNELPEAFAQMIQDGNQIGARNLYGELLNLFSGGSTSAGTIASPETVSTAAAENVLQGNSSAENGMQTSMMQNGVIQTEDVAGGQISAGDGTLQQVSPENVKSAVLQAQTLVLDAMGAGNETNAADTAEKVISSENLPEASGQSLFSDHFLQLLKAVGVPENMLSQLSQAQVQEAVQTDPSVLMKTLSDLQMQNADSSAEMGKNWTDLFSSRDFTKLLQNAISNEWLISPEKVDSRENVENLYQRLHDQTRELTQIISETAGSGSKVAQSVNNLSGNVDFMNQLNQVFAYVQLPLKMSDQNAHGDLYVYTNRKNLAQKDGQVSAILHLDMENLGPLDVYVKMKEQKVSTNFYVADDQVLDLIASHIDELNQRLQKRGYSLQARTMLQTDHSSENTVLDELLQKGEKLSLVSENSFDARA